ncbi:MAG: acyl-[ACP]--phospholipid O-acyltransferase [Planctomycetes bacterium]|nr:acyl-[ACP]--phospholipid O-acyltransferase [Planctomycetota bacterium]
MRGLYIAQFFGAFNDNALKLMVALLLGNAYAREVSGADAELARQSATTLAFVVFTLPLMLFSLPAGLFSDRFSKRSVIVSMKFVEVLLMAAATVVFYLDPQGGTLSLVLLGAMGLQSAIFSPAKYGILPELLPGERLSDGNGKLEFWTFLAIVGGTAAGGFLIGTTGASVWVAGATLTVLAVVGLFAARYLPQVPAARSDAGLVDTIGGAAKAMRSDGQLLFAVVGQTAFWFLASVLSQDILVYSKTVLALADAWVGMPLAMLVIGMGAGSVFAARLSHERVEPGLIPHGSLLLAVVTITFGVVSPGLAGSLVLLALLGVASGLMLVPLDTLLQARSPVARRGGVIALTNVLVFGGVLVGSLVTEFGAQVGLTTSGILVAAGLATLIVTLVGIWCRPLVFLRMIAILLTNTIYRQRVIGAAHVPAKGGVLLVPNHVSFLDGVFLSASIDRPIRFVVDAEYYRNPLIRLLLRPLGAIPIDSSEGPKATLRSLSRAGEYLDRGEVVCIFAEGQITRTGTMLPFKRGLERIVKGRAAPIVPVCLHGVWGSIFSYEGGRFLNKVPKRLPYPITVVLGEALPAGTSFQVVRTRVQELAEQGFRAEAATRQPLHREFIRRARWRPLRTAFSDASGRKVSRIRSVAGAVALARVLDADWQGQQHVGILLPPSVPAALANLAASMSGRTSVNLNYTAGTAGLASAVSQAGLETVLTSRTFLDKVELELPDGLRVVWIEDVAARVSRLGRVTALLGALLAPARLLERACGARQRVRSDDVCAIIFSSGSTGDPKGVMLTHGNIGANVDGVAQVIRFQSSDRLLGILPLFHSFGYMSLWAAANSGTAMSFQPNPLDAAAIGATIWRDRCTIMMATPTFLGLYAKRCDPAQFGSLRLVVAGAESLSERVAATFEDTFGLRPLEGYGATECAPVIAVSAQDFRAPGFYQAGSRRGSVGQALPGVSVRIVDVDTFEPKPVGESGMLIVRGPNVMKGYLGRPDLTAEVLRDGWYVTGDIARIDADGFITITDRLSRFSKIGGEMVPHGRIEQALQDAAGSDVQVFAVTAVPDEKRGERLAVLHTIDAALIDATLEVVSKSGLPNLFVPKRDSFVAVESLPLLGTGKLDLREVKRVAAAAL